MLRAGLQVLRPGGRLCFAAIAVDVGVQGAEAENVFAAAPPHPVADPSYAALLDRAGFIDVVVHDVTAAYRETSSDWLTEFVAEEVELSRLFGAEVFSERIAGHRGSIAAIDNGLLHRYFIAAVKSNRQGPTR